MLGHDVTVFDEQIGSGRHAAICACRNTDCRRRCCAREIELIERLGVKFIFNTRIGFDVPLNELDDRFDAVFLSIGTWKESWVYQPGTELKGVYPALAVPGVGGERRRRRARAKKVAMIGGGNAAIDSARTALRKGSNVTVFYRRERKDMPAIEEETEAARGRGREVRVPGRAASRCLATPRATSRRSKW